MVDLLKKKTDYDCSMNKSKDVKNDLIVKHFEIKKNIILSYLFNTNTFVLLIAVLLVWLIRYYL